VSLTCDQLMNFNLIESLAENTEMLMRFFTLSGEIRNLDSFIRDLPSFPMSTNKIIRSELTRVIGSTLAIEGTMLDREEIEESLNKADQGEPLKRKEQEAQNSRNVYTFIKDFVKSSQNKFTYTESVIQQIHSYFTSDIHYISNTPGQYRTFPVTFGEPRRESLCKTQSDIQSTMRGFVKWLNTTSKSHISNDPFVKAIMAHYYLTEIHPFGDGNGRTARALEAMALYVHGVNDYCFWSLANFWSSHKDEYIHHLGQIRKTLDPISFVLWGLEGYRDELTLIKKKVRRKVTELMFSDYIQFLLRNRKTEVRKLNPRLCHVLELLISKDRIQFGKFIASPEISALYYKLVASTRTRDFQRLHQYSLIAYEQVNGELFIEPNFKILNSVRYEV
jgi:Fic family protein